MTKKIVLSGYYGFKNLGDEAIIAGILHSLRKQNKNLEITVLSADPDFTEEIFDVKAVDRGNIIEILRIIVKSDLLISGGGSLLQNVTGWKSIPYYLGLVVFAQLLGKKTVFYAQGIGPVWGEKWKKIIKWVANRTNLITVRDENSYLFLKNIGVNMKQVNITGDPVFSLKNIDLEGDTVPSRFNNQFRNMIGISVRPWGNNKYLNKLAKEVNNFARKKSRSVLIIPFHYEEDREVSKEFQKKLNIPSQIFPQFLSPVKMLDLFSQLDFLIGVRLHSIIFAVLQEIPFVAISYDPKVDSFLESFNLPDPVSVKNFDEKIFRENLHKFWNNRKDFYNQEIRTKMNKNKELALQNAEMVIQLFEE